MRFIRTFKLHESITDLRGELADLGLADPWKALITLRYPDLQEYTERDLGRGEFLYLEHNGTSFSKLEIDFWPQQDEPWSVTILKKIAEGSFGLKFEDSHIWPQPEHRQYYQECAQQILQKIQSEPNTKFEIYCQNRSSFGFPKSQENSPNPLVGWSDLVFEEMFEEYQYEFEKHQEDKELESLRHGFFSDDGSAACFIKIWIDFPGNKIDPASPRWQANFGN